MAECLTFRCDECGKLKEEANHWFRAARLPVDVIETPSLSPRFFIVAWNDLLPALGKGRRYEVLHLCGMGCAVKAMTKAMEQSG